MKIGGPETLNTPGPGTYWVQRQSDRNDIANDIIQIVLGRTVLDTDVLVAAVRSARGASRLLLAAALDRRYRLLASVPLMVEYESVLTRSDHREAAGLTSADVEVLLDAVAVVVEPIRISYLWRPALTDPNDDLVLETAVNGRADVIVTFNRRDFEPTAARFGVQILLPADAVNRLERRS